MPSATTPARRRAAPESAPRVDDATWRCTESVAARRGSVASCAGLWKSAASSPPTAAKAPPSATARALDGSSSTRALRAPPFSCAAAGAAAPAAARAASAASRPAPVRGGPDRLPAPPAMLRRVGEAEDRHLRAERRGELRPVHAREAEGERRGGRRAHAVELDAALRHVVRVALPHRQVDRRDRVAAVAGRLVGDELEDVAEVARLEPVALGNGASGH